MKEDRAADLCKNKNHICLVLSLSPIEGVYSWQIWQNKFIIHYAGAGHHICYHAIHRMLHTCFELLLDEIFFIAFLIRIVWLVRWAIVNNMWLIDCLTCRRECKQEVKEKVQYSCQLHDDRLHFEFINYELWIDWVECHLRLLILIRLKIVMRMEKQ